MLLCFLLKCKRKNEGQKTQKTFDVCIRLFLHLLPLFVSIWCFWTSEELQGLFSAWKRPQSEEEAGRWRAHGQPTGSEGSMVSSCCVGNRQGFTSLLSHCCFCACLFPLRIWHLLLSDLRNVLKFTAAFASPLELVLFLCTKQKAADACLSLSSHPLKLHRRLSTVRDLGGKNQISIVSYQMCSYTSAVGAPAFKGSVGTGSRVNVLAVDMISVTVSICLLSLVVIVTVIVIAIYLMDKKLLFHYVTKSRDPDALLGLRYVWRNALIVSSVTSNSYNLQQNILNVCSPFAQRRSKPTVV